MELVIERVPLVICPSDHNAEYLNVKKQKLGHMLDEKNQFLEILIHTLQFSLTVNTNQLI